MSDLVRNPNWWFSHAQAQLFQAGLSVTYNYVDFALTPMLETYDISVCYPEAHQLKFQVRFQGILPLCLVWVQPALATCVTSQVLLAGVPGGFLGGSPVFAPPTDWPVSHELK